MTFGKGLITRSLAMMLAIEFGGCAFLTETKQDPQQVATAVSNRLSSLREQVTQDDRATGKTLDDLWSQALQACGTALTGIDQRATNVGTWQTIIAVFGSLSGVVGSAWAAADRAKSTVALASGLSGAANTAQSSVQTYLGGAQDERQVSADFRTTVNSLTDDYAAAIKAKDEASARAIVIKLTSRCQFYANAKAAAAGH